MREQIETIMNIKTRIGNGRPGRSESGAVLLMVLVVVSILFVLVGQLSWSSSMDEINARNHMIAARARCDMDGAATCFRALAQAGLAASPVTLQLSTGTAAIEWTDESGKFNLNNLAGPESAAAAAQLERLFEILEQKGVVREPGLADKISTLVFSLGRPLAALGEILQAEGMTREILDGTEGKGGISAYVTVYTDGKVNYHAAPDEVLIALVDTPMDREMLVLVKEKLDNPGKKVPIMAEKIAFHMNPFVSPTSGSYRAIITLSGGLLTKSAEVALRREQSGWKTVVFNELEGANVRFSE
jgi:type II secretory pathway component PulK